MWLRLAWNSQSSCLSNINAVNAEVGSHMWLTSFWSCLAVSTKPLWYYIFNFWTSVHIFLRRILSIWSLSSWLSAQYWCHPEAPSSNKGFIARQRCKCTWTNGTSRYSFYNVNEWSQGGLVVRKVVRAQTGELQSGRPTGSNLNYNSTKLAKLIFINLFFSNFTTVRNIKYYSFVLTTVKSVLMKRNSNIFISLPCKTFTQMF